MVPRAQRGTDQTPAAYFMGHRTAEARAKLGGSMAGEASLGGFGLDPEVGRDLPEGRKSGGGVGGSRQTELHGAVGRKSQMVCLGSQEPLGVAGRRPGWGWESPARRALCQCAFLFFAPDVLNIQGSRPGDSLLKASVSPAQLGTGDSQAQLCQS